MALSAAAGSVQVEIQDQDGRPIEGFRLDDCREIYGDEIEHTVQWEQGTTLEEIGGKPVRLRFAIKDADLYSLRFR